MVDLQSCSSSRNFVSVLRHRLAMSEIQSPRTPINLQEVFQRLQDGTPIQDYEAPEDSSKVNCLFLMDQDWWRQVDRKEVEQRRRKQIQQPPYHRVRIHSRLKMIERSVSKSELPELLKTTDVLDGLLLDLGAVSDDFENAQREISPTEKEYWDPECDFHENRREEIERLGFRYDDSPLASPTHTPTITLVPRSVNPPSPPFESACRGVSNARVQKKRHENYNETRRKQRSTRASERRKTPFQARREELDTSAFLESASGRGPITTTLSEKAVPSARVLRGRAGTKTKATGKPRQSEGVRKSTRIQNQKQITPIIDDYPLRSTKSRRNMTK